MPGEGDAAFCTKMDGFHYKNRQFVQNLAGCLQNIAEGLKPVDFIFSLCYNIIKLRQTIAGGTLKLQRAMERELPHAVAHKNFKKKAEKIYNSSVLFTDNPPPSINLNRGNRKSLSPAPKQAR